jgi:uncharacterized membrane protein
MQKIITLFFLLITTFISGCTYESEEEKYKTEAGCDDVIPEFESDVKPIINQYCVVCHGPTNAQNNIRLDNDSVLIDLAESGLLEEVLNLPSDNPRKMPQGGTLPPCDLELLIQWIHNLNN